MEQQSGIVKRPQSLELPVNINVTASNSLVSEKTIGDLGENDELP